MATIGEFLKNLESINLLEEVGNIIDHNTGAIKQLNREQMLQGKNNQGGMLPSILGDPYFKKPGADKRYADFKHRLFPESPYGISNFTVFNRFHNSIKIFRNGGLVTFDSSVSFAGAIESKTNNTVLGLNDESKGTAWRMIIRPELVQTLASKLGAKTK